MTYGPRRPKWEALGVRARFVVVGVLGSLLLLGALHVTGADPGASVASQTGEHPSYVVQHEATVTSNAANPSRSHRLVALGAFVVVAGGAALAAHHLASRRRARSRRRIEQFHVRLRGPPYLFVAH